MNIVAGILGLTLLGLGFIGCGGMLRLEGWNGMAFAGAACAVVIGFNIIQAATKK